jgi:REP element-mobilizing transposase RayT
MTSRRPNSLRLQNYDYTNTGAYFITIVTYRREAILGDVKAGQLNLSGRLPRAGLKFAANQPTYVPDTSSINEPAPTGGKSLSEIIRNFKTVSAKRINLLRRLPNTPIWQRGFHDRIIRNEEELNAVRLYIQTNPQRWAEQS